MTARWRRTALAAAAVAALLALAWFAGGQAQLGRIDPALVLPWVPLVLVPSAMVRHRSRGPVSPASARKEDAFVMGLLVLAQAVLALMLAGQMPWRQLLLVGFGAGLVAWLASLLAQWRAGRMVRGVATLLYNRGWYVASHLMLATL